MCWSVFSANTSSTCQDTDKTRLLLGGTWEFVEPSHYPSLDAYGGDAFRHNVCLIERRIIYGIMFTICTSSPPRPGIYLPLDGLQNCCFCKWVEIFDSLASYVFDALCDPERVLSALDIIKSYLHGSQLREDILRWDRVTPSPFHLVPMISLKSVR